MNNITVIIIAILIGYLLGSIPFSLVIGKIFYNTDVRKFGSGNLGGTNTGRVLGKKAGIAVIVLDILKVVLASWIIYLINPQFYILASVAAAFGHCYPIFAHFKGGKAVATMFGFLLSIAIFDGSWGFFIRMVLFFLILLRFTRIVSLTSMTTVLIAAIILTICYQIPYIIAGWCFAILIIFRHRANIERILNKKEKKITWM